MFKTGRSESKLDAFARDWIPKTLSEYEAEYCGQRAGTPRGESLPFPPEKVRAAFALLWYGGEDSRVTLGEIARQLRISEGVLRVWRTEDRFWTLHSKAVWAFVDAVLGHLREREPLGWYDPNVPNELLTLFRSLAGVVQQSLLRLVWQAVDFGKWRPLTSDQRVLSEVRRLGNPPGPRLTLDERERTKFSAYLLGMLGTLSWKDRDKYTKMFEERAQLASIVINRVESLIQEGKKDQALTEISQFLRQMAHPFSGRTEKRVTPSASYARGRSPARAKAARASRG